MSKQVLALEVGKIYVIEGSPVIYIESEGNRHYFQKTNQQGQPIGRRRMLMGTEEQIASVLLKKLG